jgi:hypothetical protein
MKQYKSYMPIYIYYCIMITISVLILKYTIFDFFFEKQLFSLFMVSILLYWIPLMSLYAINGAQMSRYLRKNYYEEWKKWGFSRDGTTNIFSNHPDDDFLNKLQKDANKIMMTAYIIMFLVFVLFIIFGVT